MARTIHSIKAALGHGAFLMHNVLLARHLPIFSATSFGGVSVSPCQSQFLMHVGNVYSALNDGRRLSLRNQALLHLAGTRLCLVVTDGSEDVAGMALYYFNARDRREHTVHEGYIGLAPGLRGRGLGTALRKHALAHFSSVPWLKGMSSRVSVSNAPSLNGNLRLGFAPVEEYFDAEMREARCYLVCRFDRHRGPLRSSERALSGGGNR